MANNPLFLISTGTVSNGDFQQASSDIAGEWSCELKTKSCHCAPNQTIKELGSEFVMVKLEGDPAISTLKEGNWLEALAAWKKPTILFDSPNSANEIRGLAAG